MPIVAGSEVNDDPFAPISKYARNLIDEAGDDTPIAWVGRDSRYVEKLATPDVTIADIIGDVDPISAARGGHILSDELTIHYGMLPRANRGIFALNELPDLAGKVQVGLFNVMQEGDVQIKGYPVRLPLDVLLCFTANPEDYTARGKIITPLKDRIGSEIITHYPETVELGMAITAQEAWTKRDGRRCACPTSSPRSIERVAFEARNDKRIDKRSGVSQRMPITRAGERRLERGAARDRSPGRTEIVPRISDVYAALPAITGKIELEYEGELVGGHAIARELIRRAADATFQERAGGVNTDDVVIWFDEGGALQVTDDERSDAVATAFEAVPGCVDARAARRARDRADDAATHGRGVRAGARGARRAQEDLAHRRRHVRARRAGAAAPAPEPGLLRRTASRPRRGDRWSSAGGRAWLAAAHEPVPLTVACARRAARPRGRGRAAHRAAARASGPSDLRPAARRGSIAARASCSRRSCARARRRSSSPSSGARWSAILRCVESIGSPLLEPARYAYVSSVYVDPTCAAAACSARSSPRPSAGAARAGWTRCGCTTWPAARPPSARGMRSASRSWSRCGCARSRRRADADSSRSRASSARAARRWRSAWRARSDWHLYDNDVVDEAARRLGMTPEEVSAREERVPSLPERIASAMALGMPEVMPTVADLAMQPSEERIVEMTQRVIEEAVQRRTGRAGRARGAVHARRARRRPARVLLRAARGARRATPSTNLGVAREDAARDRGREQPPARAVREAALEARLARLRQLPPLREHRAGSASTARRS